MPCPFFEPQTLALDAVHPDARLPLLDEYQGVCHAVPEPFLPSGDLRFRCCNHGYSLGSCTHFPATEIRSCIRFDVVRSDATVLELLRVEECNHAPAAWKIFRFVLSTEAIEPELSDVCARAQLLAFCRSYLRRFSIQSSS